MFFFGSMKMLCSNVVSLANIESVTKKNYRPWFKFHFNHFFVAVVFFNYSKSFNLILPLLLSKNAPIERREYSLTPKVNHIVQKNIIPEKSI